MEKPIYISFFLLISTFSALSQDFEYIESFDLPPIKIFCTISCENPDRDYYEISWQVPYIDSISGFENELPKTELHCFVYDSKSLVGHYTGTSYPLTHCSFITKDTTVNVFFRIRNARFDPYTSIQIDRVDLFTSLTATPYRGHDYGDIRLSTNSTLNKEVTLKNDSNTVLLKYGMHPQADPIGYPTIAGYSQTSVLSLDRFYLNLKTGKIKSGQTWIEKKGIEKIASYHRRYLLIYPFTKYVDRNEYNYLGEALISKGKVKLKHFELGSFIKQDRLNYAY